MNQVFITIIKKLVTDKGNEILFNPAAYSTESLLADRTRNEYERERNLLLQACDLGGAKAIFEAQNLGLCKRQQIDLLQNKRSITAEAAVEVVDLLAMLLRGDIANTEMSKINNKPEKLPQEQPVIIPEPSALQPQSQASKTPVPNSGIKLSLTKNSIIPFGNFEWLVLNVQDDRALIISKNIIEYARKYNTQFTDVTWETCTLRKYLNSEFFQKFTAEQKKRIIETQITNNDNPWFGIEGGNDTNDKIFLLSIKEVVKYFGDSGRLKNKWRRIVSNHIGDQYNSARAATYARSARWWWLRSPGYSSGSAAYVNDDGSVNVTGNSVDYNLGGVRPALWLNL